IDTLLTVELVVLHAAKQFELCALNVADRLVLHGRPLWATTVSGHARHVLLLQSPHRLRMLAREVPLRRGAGAGDGVIGVDVHEVAVPRASATRHQVGRASKADW